MPLPVDSVLSLHANIQNAFEALIAARERGADTATLINAEQAVVKAAQVVEATLLTPTDRVLRLAMLPAVNTATKIAQLLDIFSIVKEEISIDELAASTGADPVLLLRIMRCLTAYDIFIQTCTSHFRATAFSRKLAEGPAGSFIKLTYDTVHVMNRGIPAALLRTGFENPRDFSGSGAVEAWGKSIFQHIAEDPSKAAEYGLAMEVHGELDPEYYAHFPFMEAREGLSKNPGAITIVDVAGGHGHVLRDIIKDNPKLPGRFILQDLPVVVHKLQERDLPFELMVQDIFQPQNLTDVKFWHLRHVIHDWPDAESLRILTHLRNACVATNKLHGTSSYSRILIQEFVLSDINCGRREVNEDMMMMGCLGMERSEMQWKELLYKSGLKIVKVWRAAVGDYAIVEAEPYAEYGSKS